MIYLKKNNMMYYRLDSETKTLMELFVSSLQCRVFLITNEDIYNATVERTTRDQFETATETEFNEVLATAKSKLLPA